MPGKITNIIITFILISIFISISVYFNTSLFSYDRYEPTIIENNEVVPSQWFQIIINDPQIQTIKFTKVSLPGASFFLWHTNMIDWVMKNNSGEGKVMETFHRLLYIEKTHYKNEIVVDIGANTGIYGLYAASLGYQTLLIDPQPACHLYQHIEITFNRLEHLVTVITNPLGRTSNVNTVKVSPQTPCVGDLRLSTSSQFSRLTSSADPASFSSVYIMRFDDIYQNQQTILLMKIDTEGFEADILIGMKRLLVNRQIKNIVVEITPLFWPEFGMDRLKVAEEIASLWDYGFTNALKFANNNDANKRDLMFNSKEELFNDLAYGNFVQNDFYFNLK